MINFVINAVWVLVGFGMGVTAGLIVSRKAFKKAVDDYIKEPSYSRRQSQIQYNSYINRPRKGYVETIMFETRDGAEEVLSHLVDLIESYNQVTIADLYELTARPSNYTDIKYGWTNLANAMVKRFHNGYMLELPKAETLK